MTLQKKLLSVGNYKFTGKKLGKGNFARVEEAIHALLNVKVAVKIMDITLIKEDYIIRNLQREARIMSQLHHPCISALFQTMQHGNLYYLVTELIGGGDLCCFIKTQKYGKLDERNTKVYARQLVSALAHMHNLGIVHRDLKMENVMMNSMQTQIKIVDFGLSNSYNPGSPLRTHCGSPEYAAPELFVPGKSYGPEVDLWSLGVILFGMVAGQLPFIVVHDEDMASQERRRKLLVQINKGYSTMQRKILSLASSDFRVMISRMLVADPMKRITVNELLFENWITDKGRRAIVTSPYKKMGDEWQILKQLSANLDISPNSIQHARIVEPEGDIAGMYNIVAYKLRDQRLEGDGVSKVIQHRPVITVERKDSPASLPSRTSSKKRVDRVKSPSVPKIQKMSVESVAPRKAAVKRALPTPDKNHQSSVSSTQPRSNLSVQRKSSKQKSIFTIDVQNRLHSATEKHIREQLQYLREQLTHPSELSQHVTASSKPRYSSATPQRSLQHSVAKAKIQQTPSATIPVGRTASHPITFKNEVQILGTKGVATALLQKKSSARRSIRTSLKSNPSKMDTSTSEPSKNKLERTSSKHSGMVPLHLIARQPTSNRNENSKRFKGGNYSNKGPISTARQTKSECCHAGAKGYRKVSSCSRGWTKAKKQ